MRMTRTKPRHVVLAGHFHDLIRKGHLSPGDKLPSFNEMRAQHGIGRDTYERMLGLLEKEGFITRESRRGIFVTDPRRPVRLGVIGFVSPYELQHHPYYANLLAGIREEAYRAGVEVLLLHSDSKIRWEKVDGVLYQATLRSHIDKPPGIPQVSLVAAQPDMDSVVADDYSGMKQAMEHLCDLGHQRIAYLTSELNPRTMSQQRLAAYSEVLRLKGITPDSAWVRPLSDPEERQWSYEETGYHDMKRWLKEDWYQLQCSALLVQNDEAAIGVMEALREAGIDVPEQVSIIAFDGTEISQYHRPQISTVKVPLREIGVRGCRLLMEQVVRPLVNQHDDEPPARVVLPTTLQPGQTTSAFTS